MRYRSLAGLIAPLLLSAVCQAQGLPHYKLDPSWPNELPNNWIFGQVTGVAVDHDDHIWVLSDPTGVPRDDAAAAQTPPWSHCCIPAPAVVEFDVDGNVIRAWGEKDMEPNSPAVPHGITVDKKGDVWIGGVSRPWNPDLPKAAQAPTGASSAHRVLKFSPNGKLLLEIGKSSSNAADNQDTAVLEDPTAIKIDDTANEVYIADGLLNSRVLVYDSNTGVFSRGWGAYGIPLSKIAGAPQSANDPHSRQFGGLTDIAVSEDGLVYVADQNNDRIQVFTKLGKFVTEFGVAPKTLGPGSAWGLTLSRDPSQQYLFVADGASDVIRILNRHDGAELLKLGHKGRSVAEFVNLAFVALDSKSDLYTGEVHFTRSWDGWQAAHTGKVDAPGGRVQKFVPAN